MTTLQDLAAETFPKSPDANNREAVYSALEPLVKRLVRKYAAGREERDDLHSEIYLCFCTLYRAYDPSRGIPLRPYLVANLPRSVYTHVRSGWRRQRREAPAGVLSEDLLDQLQQSRTPAPTVSWDPCTELEDVVGRLPGALARVPLRQRQVVIGRFYDGRSFEEIAASLEVKPATARSLLRHGLANLRAQFAGGCAASTTRPRAPAPNKP